MKQLIGAFSELITLRHLPNKGVIKDADLEILQNAGIVWEGDKIVEIDDFEKLAKKYASAYVHPINQPSVAMPGLVDCHTHICWAGSRADDFAKRINGTPYLEIAKAGGGIMSSVRKTRAATLEELTFSTIQRANKHLKEGITTCEVKSGYGLSVSDELKILKAIQSANQQVQTDLIPTCLAAHICPPEFSSATDYLAHLLQALLPKIRQENLCDRIDIFVEDTAFSADEAQNYLVEARRMGFSLVIHADQFGTAGSRLACALNVLSADHLENSTDKEIELLANSDVVAVVLPGASLGLGMKFAPTRKLLDAGCCVAIASDWNPGSAPMGDLWTQAAILATFERLSTAEVFAGITFRAAKSLKLEDRGRLETGKKADWIVFDCGDYREILYHQGTLKPHQVWKNGQLVA